MSLVFRSASVWFPSLLICLSDHIITTHRIRLPANVINSSYRPINGRHFGIICSGLSPTQSSLFFLDWCEKHHYPHGCFLPSLPWVCLVSPPHMHRPVSAAEGSGHSSREELAGDLRERGDHDWGLFPESVPGSGQEEGGTDYHWLWDREAHRHPEKGRDLFYLFSLWQHWSHTLWMERVMGVLESLETWKDPARLVVIRQTKGKRMTGM